MIERTVTVKSTEWLDTKDGKKQYLSAVLQADSGKESKQSIFDPAIQKIVEQAEKDNAPLNIKLEKEGNFWNIKSASREMSAKENVERSRPYRNEEAIMLQVAFKGAVECERYWYIPDGKQHNARIIQNTEELFVGLQDLLKDRGNSLIEEAKRLGAVEK